MTESSRADPQQGASSQDSKSAAGKIPVPPVGISWKKPEAWKEMAAGPMRQATYEVPGKAGPAEVAVFYFGPEQGGGIEANISRWVGQFQDLPEGVARRDQREVSGYQIYTVRVEEGTFAGGMPGAPADPRDGWGLHAAVVEAPSGSYFFKMTGPAETVSEQEASFAALLDSIEKKD